MDGVPYHIASNKPTSCEEDVSMGIFSTIVIWHHSPPKKKESLRMLKQPPECIADAHLRRHEWASLPQDTVHMLETFIWYYFQKEECMSLRTKNCRQTCT
jgi:hypothetical protein